MDVGWTAVVVAVVIGVATIYPLYKPKPTTRVQYIVKPTQTLVNIPSGVDASVSIGGVPVTNAFSVEIRLANSGRTSFAPSDWDSKLVIQLASTTQILSARQIGASPAQLRVNIHRFDDHLEIDPFLMNPKDLVAVQLVCEGAITSLSAHARIKELQSVKRRRIPYNPGMGPDGQLEYRAEVVVLFVLPIVVGIGLAILGSQLPGSVFDRVVYATIGFCLAGILGPLWSRAQVMTSRLWRPVERIDA